MRYGVGGNSHTYFLTGNVYPLFRGQLRSTGVRSDDMAMGAKGTDI